VSANGRPGIGTAEWLSEQLTAVWPRQCGPVPQVRNGIGVSRWSFRFSTVRDLVPSDLAHVEHPEPTAKVREIGAQPVRGSGSSSAARGRSRSWPGRRPREERGLIKALSARSRRGKDPRRREAGQRTLSPHCGMWSRSTLSLSPPGGDARSEPQLSGRRAPAPSERSVALVFTSPRLGMSAREPSGDFWGEDLGCGRSALTPTERPRRSAAGCPRCGNDHRPVGDARRDDALAVAGGAIREGDPDCAGVLAPSQTY
jgi:hypothetical protein